VSSREEATPGSCLLPLLPLIFDTSTTWLL
jgi:hypothetical protein